MNQQKNINPFEMWKEIYNQSSILIDEKMKDESNSKVMGQVLEMNLQFKKMLNETTESYLEEVNIPTRNDLSNISSLIINVDSKVDDLEELIEETSANQVNQAELKREMTDIKNKMKNLDTKLKEILTLLKTERSENNQENAEKEHNQGNVEKQEHNQENAEKQEHNQENAEKQEHNQEIAKQSV